jgi:homoserine kinase type II
MAILTVPTSEDLAAFADQYALGALAGAEGIAAGTVNTSFRLTLGGQPFFLRIYEEQDALAAAREADLLAYLAASSVPTPCPLRGEDGLLVRPLAGKPAALFPWIAGEMVCQRAVTVEVAREVGSALAHLHTVGRRAGATMGPGRFGPVHLARRCERVAASTDPEARALAGALRDAVLEAVRRDLPSGLVHGDLFRDNVLWRGGRIAALLDFESAHEGPFAYDLAVTILSWCFDSDLRVDLAAAMVSGYRALRPLEAPEREALYDEAMFATLRFTITRITDDAIRVGKRWQRFVARRHSLERLGRGGFAEALGL